MPEERQAEAPPELIGPVLEKMRYLGDQSELWRMYEEVITKSVDTRDGGIDSSVVRSYHLTAERP